MRHKLNVSVLITPARKVCEHLTVAGATVDLIGFCLHFDWFGVVFLAGKGSALLGIIGYILVVSEERRQHRIELEAAKSAWESI